MKTSPYPHLQQRDAKPVTISDLARMKAEGEKIACLTAYDASFAALEDRAGVDVVLVGDSLGMVVQGASTTVPVTVNDMVYHSRITAAGLDRAFLMTDLPFLSYATKHDALETSRRLMGEGAAQMVKFEGGEIQANTIEHLSMRGVPVCAHIGLQPQLVHKMGGFKVQGRGDAAETMIRDAKLLETIIKSIETCTQVEIHKLRVISDGSILESPRQRSLLVVAGIRVSTVGNPNVLTQ